MAPSSTTDLYPRPFPSRLGLALTLLLAACGGGGSDSNGNGGGGGDSAPPEDLETSLRQLGVNTDTTARIDDQGDDLPEDYTPFGTTWNVATTRELLVLGLESSVTNEIYSLMDLTDEDGNATAQALDSIPVGDIPWAEEDYTQNAKPVSLRAATGADTDGDGFEEVVIAYQDDLETRLLVVDDQSGSFERLDVQIALEMDVRGLAVEGADLDGDGSDELVVGLTIQGVGTLIVVDRTENGFEPLDDRVTYENLLVSSSVSLRLAAGNLDTDPAEELVVTVNEDDGTVRASQYSIHDDLEANLAVLLTDEVEGRDEDGAQHFALTSDPTVGDIDGDGIGEVVIGSVTEFPRFCDPAEYFVMFFEDAGLDFESLGNDFFTYGYDCDSPSDPEVQFAFTNALDIDGDSRDEIQVNLFVYEDFFEGAPLTRVADYQIPEEAFYEQNDHAFFNPMTADVVTADFTGDERDDVAVLRQDTNEVSVWGVSQTDGFVSKQRSVPVAFKNSQDPAAPVLAAVNVDTDSPVLRYSEAEYKLVFTEPIVLAALAASPCIEGVGQNTGACVTAFGNTETVGAEGELSVSFRASSTVGASFDGGFVTQSSAEFKKTVTAEATAFVSTAYELQKTILFTSGPNEDLVVFTTVPFDQYTYTVLSHPDPDLIGETIVVNLPREPITLQAERDFYNQSVEEGSIRIDESVFQHQIGNVTTYPTPGQRNALLAGSGLQVGPVSVGQGTGETEVTLEVGTEIGVGGALELSYDIESEVTAGGAVVGGSVGASVGAEFRVTSGSSTTYTGVVGALPGESFADNQYSFGLFTYVHRDPVTGREFEVLNYWVE